MEHCIVFIYQATCLDEAKLVHMGGTIIQLLSNLKVEHSTIIVCNLLRNCAHGSLAENAENYMVRTGNLNRILT